MRADELDVFDVRDALGLSDRAVAVLQRVDRSAVSAGPVLPTGAEATRLLGRLDVGAEDVAATLAARPDPDRDPALWWVLDTLFRDLVAELGRRVSDEGFRGWPAMPASTGSAGRLLYVWLFLAMVPVVRRYHADHGVSDDISWASLSQLGKTMARDRKLSGVPGLGLQWSLPLIFRGVFYNGLGRLAFDRHTMMSDSVAAIDGLRPRRGDAVVNVHIRGGGGPLIPTACDDSIALAREFFARRFPERPIAFMCHTWLLDPQLAQYLPRTSNILRFQQRFQILPGTDDVADRPMLQLVFGRHYDGAPLPAELLADLPQDTTLERAFVDHVRSGRHWHSRTGWFPF